MLSREDVGVGDEPEVIAGDARGDVDPLAAAA